MSFLPRRCPKWSGTVITGKGPFSSVNSCVRHKIATWGEWPLTVFTGKVPYSIVCSLVPFEMFFVVETFWAFFAFKKCLSKMNIFVPLKASWLCKRLWTLVARKRFYASVSSLMNGQMAVIWKWHWTDITTLGLGCVFNMHSFSFLVNNFNLKHDFLTDLGTDLLSQPADWLGGRTLLYFEIEKNIDW